ncbi:TlpA family protein disulfide reductase [Echinicola soli]|uniref:TlpA family protein disulfide reductase n=1 Tax=Echinicola soli TaxID=2591634 RepID=A0A514CMZ5_9BACT|nr:TlpA disulfide reductase family protein [Echinicola soli]QDH81203.1 TlpA family protein disulfide reductase [Echinicola soli]
MKKNTCLCLLVYLCLVGKVAYAQLQEAGSLSLGKKMDSTSRVIQDLKIGDRMPDLTVANVINHPEGEVKISDYKGKLLILDFWATWCAPCVKGMPEIAALDREMEQVAILPVTYQDKEEVEKLFSRLDYLKGISMPMAVSDEQLRKLFPHRTLPHYVWINGEGVVLAFTGKEAIVKDSIQRVLEGEKLVEIKAPPKALFDRNELLLMGNRGFDEDKEILLQSVFLPYIEDMPAMYKVSGKPDRSRMRIFLTNSRIPTFFGLAYGAGKVEFNRNRRVLEVDDPGKLRHSLSEDDYDEWKLENRFCYELLVSPKYPGQEYDIMKEDLKRMFPQYKATIEERKTEVLALVRTDDSIGLETKGGKPYSDMDYVGASLKNKKISLLAYYWRYYLQHLKLPVVDATGMDYPVDILLEGKMSDVGEIRKSLRPFGLDLVKKEMPIDILVIRDSERE